MIIYYENIKSIFYQYNCLKIYKLSNNSAVSGHKYKQSLTEIIWLAVLYDKKDNIIHYSFENLQNNKSKISFGTIYQFSVVEVEA